VKIPACRQAWCVICGANTTSPLKNHIKSFKNHNSSSPSLSGEGVRG